MTETPKTPREQAAALRDFEAALRAAGKCPACGEPEDGGEFGWFDADDGKTYCNNCGAVQ